jgi:hypothetical protein
VGLPSEGVTLATVIKATFSAPLSHREAVRLIADSFEDFVVSPDLGPLWHVKYVYEDRPGSFRVTDMVIATPSGTFASTEITLRLPE